MAQSDSKIRQDISIGSNIRRIRKAQGIGQTELVAMLQLHGTTMTRECLVKIEGGRQAIKASQLQAIEETLSTTYDELFKPCT